MENKIPAIVITGGPCSGKTTGIKKIQEKFTKDGYRVFVGREIPTDIILGGVSDIGELAKENTKEYVEVERQMLLENIAQLKNLFARAKIFSAKGEKCLIFLDRFAMDQMGYLRPGVFERIMREEGLTYFDVRDCLAGTAHLLTTAEGAEKFYSLRNNKARYESTLKAARDADRKTRNAWLGHPHFQIIDNSTGFKKKMKRLYKTICSFLEPVEIERRFLLRRPPDFTKRALRESVKISIAQDYLITRDGSAERIRRRTQDGCAIYYRTRKSKIPGSKFAQNEVEEIISEKDYWHLMKRRDTRTRTIIKNRYHFIHSFQVFELDQILSPRRLWILEKELLDEKEKIILPAFFHIKSRDEITGDPKYSNYGIAKGL